jgi:acyl-CoA hydrolase
MLAPKKPNDSFTVMNEMILPNDTNVLNNLMGGRLLHFMDICAAIAAQKHSGRVVVTASVDSVSFKEPVKLGDVVTLEAWVTRAFTSSMEVFIRVTCENIPTRRKVKCNEAYYTFVAVDQLGTPIAVPPIQPETEEDQHRFEDALKRRQLRLLIAGKIKPEDAPELKELFSPKAENL